MNSGRAPETKALGLEKLGVRLDKETGKIIVAVDESTSVPNIYAFGDIGEVGIVSSHCADSRGEKSPYDIKEKWAFTEAGDIHLCPDRI